MDILILFHGISADSCKQFDPIPCKQLCADFPAPGTATATSGVAGAAACCAALPPPALRGRASSSAASAIAHDLVVGGAGSGYRWWYQALFKL